MKITQKVKKILTKYESDNPGTKANLARILSSGKLGGTGKLLILPVDQGFEHGPARSFAPNPQAYDPHYHWNLAIDAGLSAFAAPLGLLELGADTFAGSIPTILKINSANSLNGETEAPSQAITANVSDAIRLGCSAIGYTIYPGSINSYEMIEDLREISEEARALGLALVVWSYPRGAYVSKSGETALDIVSYAAHMAALAGAHIIKVKLPSDSIELSSAQKVYQENSIPSSSLSDRVKHVVQSCFNGKRLVVFSGGGKKDLNGLYDEAKAIHKGGGNGSIIGRNTFKRKREEAIMMLNNLIAIYKGVNL